MKLGLAIFPTAQGLHPAELAQIAEARGFESLFFPEHSHIPASRESHSDRSRGELGFEYSHTFDPFVALSTAASATETLRLGTGICLVIERDPIHTAKSVATLDHLSGGRFLFGVGAGWNREEMRNHGTVPGARFEVMRERVEAMKAIWTSDEASYHGRFVEFDRIWAWPKPIQQPHPPVLIGGNGPTVFDRVLEFGDEWLPEPAPGLRERIAELQERARAMGCEQPVPVTVYGAEPERVADYERAGVHRCVFWLPPRGEAQIRRRLDQLSVELGLEHEERDVLPR